MAPPRQEPGPRRTRIRPIHMLGPITGDARAVSQVITGEAVAIDLRVARVGSRLIGAALDAIPQVILFVLLVALSARIAGDEALAAALSLVSYVLVAVGYPLVLETLWGGRTLGKAAMGLRAVRDDGSPMRFRQSLVRALMRAIADA